MGTAVWTSPCALKFQINWADVYSCNSSTDSLTAPVDTFTSDQSAEMSLTAQLELAQFV